MADDVADSGDFRDVPKRVLAVIGSPHRGATVRAVEGIEARLRAAGGIEVEYLCLRDAGLEPCRGCFRCIAAGEVRCPCRDGRDAVLARLDACDGAIFASPNYVQNVSGLYKTFVDRFAWVCHRPRFYAKPALAVATSAGPFGLKETLAAIQTGPAAWGFVFVDEVGIAVHPRLGAGAESREKAEAALDRAAERLIRALHATAPYRPERWRVLHFRSMRAITLARPEACPADTAYYLPLADRDFFVPARLSPIDRLAGAFVDRAVRRHVRREYVPKP